MFVNACLPYPFTHEKRAAISWPPMPLMADARASYGRPCLSWPLMPLLADACASYGRPCLLWPLMPLIAAHTWLPWPLLLAPHRLEQLMVMGSVVLKEESGYRAFFHHLMKPYEHYIPIWKEVNMAV